MIRINASVFFDNVQSIRSKRRTRDRGDLLTKPPSLHRHSTFVTTQLRLRGNVSFLREIAVVPVCRTLVRRSLRPQICGLRVATVRGGMKKVAKGPLEGANITSTCSLFFGKAPPLPSFGLLLEPLDRGSNFEAAFVVLHLLLSPLLRVLFQVLFGLLHLLRLLLILLRLLLILLLNLFYVLYRLHLATFFSSVGLFREGGSVAATVLTPQRCFLLPLFRYQQRQQLLCHILRSARG